MVILIKCMGDKSETLTVHSDQNVMTAFDVKKLISEKCKVSLSDIILKNGGTVLSEENIVNNNAKLISIIKKNANIKIKSAAPPPTEPLPTTNLCIGWKRTCQFYSPKTGETQGYCSMCFKRKTRDENPQPVVQSHTVQTPTPTLSNDNNNNGDCDTINTRNDARCFSCNKYTGLLGFSCKCGFKYCGLHRYPEQHNCNFDYKQSDRQKLAQQLVNVNGNKINKI